jgi:uncharacterized protein (TIGR00369 family)
MAQNPHSVFDEPPLSEGEWAGWVPIRGHDPFEDHAGPFFFRADHLAKPLCALRVEKRHTNGSGGVHGGCIMTLVDLALFAIAREALGTSPAVTVSLNGDFAGPAVEGDVLIASGQVFRAGGSLIFVHGEVTTSSRPVLAFSGVLKKLSPRRA